MSEIRKVRYMRFRNNAGTMAGNQRQFGRTGWMLEVQSLVENVA